MTGKKRWIGLLLLASAMATGPGSSFAADVEIEGEGATFPAPVYLEWVARYRNETGRIVRYRPTSSGEGIDRVEKGLVDFGATDAPLGMDEARRHGVAQFPILVGGVVPVVNITGIAPGQLKLSGQVLGDIYLGKILRWDDPGIAALNPELELPHTHITVVHRSDSSGTTFLWTEFLSMSSPEWKARVGASKAVNWPAGVAETGNEGVASLVQRTRMSIGYVEYAYAHRHQLTYASLRNRDGHYVQPGRQSFEATVASARWLHPGDLDQLLVDRPGPACWPIVGSSFILVRSDPARQAAIRGTLSFFDWALRHGGEAVADLDYVAMPDAAAGLVRERWSAQLVDSHGTPLWHPVRP